MEPLNKDTSRFVLCREVVLFQRCFFIECVYKSTFGLSLVGRFVLLSSVLYWGFHCISSTYTEGTFLMNQQVVLN